MHARNTGIAIVALSALAAAQSARIVPGQNHVGSGLGLFGSAIATPGDLDGDGTADFVVANLGGPPTVNVVTAFSGANGSTIWSTAPLSTCGPGTGRGFCSALAAIGDINGDGVPDIAVGADFASPAGACSANGEGAVLIFSGLTGALLATLAPTSPTANEHFGNQLAGLPDLNGDGIPEIAVGNSPNLSTASRGIYVFDGRTLTQLLFVPYANVLPILVGTAMTLGPDVDLNGVPDLLLATSGGLVGVAFLGKSPPSLSVSLFGGGPNASGAFGASVCAANVDHGGNLPGITFPDIAVGDPGFNAPGALAAGAIQFFDLTTLGGPPHATIAGVMQSEGLGLFVCSSPDIDGDGASDILASSSFLVGGIPTPSVAVFSGLQSTRLWNVTMPSVFGTPRPTAWTDTTTPRDGFAEFLVSDGVASVVAMFGGPKAKVVLDTPSCGIVPISLTMAITAPPEAVAENRPALGDTLSLSLTGVKAIDLWIMGVSSEGSHNPSPLLGGCPETANLSDPALQSWGFLPPPNPNGATFPVLTGFVIPANPSFLGNIAVSPPIPPMRVAYQSLTVMQSNFTPTGADGLVLQLGW
jgi:hypothetical protein